MGDYVGQVLGARNLYPLREFAKASLSKLLKDLRVPPPERLEHGVKNHFLVSLEYGACELGSHVTLGRPKVDVDAAKIACRRRTGASWAKIGRKLGVGEGAVRRAVSGGPSHHSRPSSRACSMHK